MSAPAAAPADAPKKKGKLPVILALALVLGGGGFFMMKGKGKDEHKPAIALAEHESEMEEFLTNTANPGVYVRAKLSVRLTKEFTEEKFKNAMGDVRDAVLTVLNATPPADITDATKRLDLKKRLAEAMNTALEGPLEEEPEHKTEHEAPKRTGKSTEKEPEPEKKLDWDSETGPVLQVRFGALATQ